MTKVYSLNPGDLIVHPNWEDRPDGDQDLVVVDAVEVADESNATIWYREINYPHAGPFGLSLSQDRDMKGPSDKLLREYDDYVADSYEGVQGPKPLTLAEYVRFS